MRVLAFDSTAPILTVGLAEGEAPVGRWDSPRDRHRGNLLDDLIDRALSGAGWRRRDIGGLALVTGPGSLTAIRLGWATACGWALASGIPIAGWPTPEVHWRKWMQPEADTLPTVRQLGSNVTFFCAVHHRGNEFYLYEFESDRVPDKPLPIVLGAWHPRADGPMALVGPGVLGFRDRWIAAIGPVIQVATESEVLVGGDHLALWGSRAIAEGNLLSPDVSPLNYGLPPTFKKTA